MYFTDTARPAEITPAHPEVLLYEDFLGIDTTDIVAKATGYKGTAPGTADTATIAVTAGLAGAAKILSGTADNDHVFLSTELSFQGKLSACFETRLALDSASAVGLMIGFCDTNGIANAGPITLATTTFSKAAQEFAGFVYDTDATTKTIRVHGIKGNAFNATPVDTAAVPVAATYNVFRVELEDDGTTVNAKCYIDGALVGTINDAVTRTAALTPFIAVGTRTGAAQKYALVDYCKAWQRRS
jgi:hypothetical protein